MNNVDASGGPSDGHIDKDITTEEQVLKIISEKAKTNIAYSWDHASNRLIEKPPSKKVG